MNRAPRRVWRASSVFALFFRELAAVAVLSFPLLAHAGTLTFPDALDRALRERSAATLSGDHSALLDALPLRTMPVVRAETAYSSAENLNLLSESVGRVDAFTALVSVDYPLLDRGGERRRVDALRADAELIRRRALDESGDVFRDTLDAFARLYIAERRIDLLRDGAVRAAALRERARAKLDAGEISNLTASQWQDQALDIEAQVVDLELQRLEAETRLKQLIGDRSGDTLRAALTLDDDAVPSEQGTHDPIVEGDAAVTRAMLVQERQRLALQEAVALRRPQLLLSAFGGVAAVPGTYRSDAGEGTFGIYGVRMTLSLPMFDAAVARRLAEARIQFDEATRLRALTETAMRNRIDLLRLALAAAGKRISLLSDAVQVAKQRQESVNRLVLAGARPESDLVESARAVARRESDLLAARVERWKLQQHVRHAGNPRGLLPSQTASR